ncbi:hypothetical protein DB217_17320 [Salmonella enterica subsp. enterica serovar Chester]|nr:hypothetical protein [Salmonella enterica subsp. enterica serovar Chester]MLT46679.1 hypothetical protein [Salmonella enterica subsp. enterica serovar Chester]
MKDVTQTSRMLMLCCFLVGGAISLSASATDDVPEVLRYAQQYNRANPESVMRPGEEKKVHGHLGNFDVGGLSRKLARSEFIRRQQQVQLKTLEEKLRASEGALKTERCPELSHLEPDVQTLRLKNDALGRDLAAAIEKQTALAKQVSTLQQEKEALLTKVSVEAKAQQKVRQKADAALKAESDALTVRTAELATAHQRIDALAAEKVVLERTIQTLRQHKPSPKNGGQVLLNTAEKRQAYAAGVMYAKDVQKAQDGNRMLGVDLDSAALMAGLDDVLSRQPLRLGKNELATAGHDLEKAASEGFQRVTDAQKKQAEAWLKAFRKEKGVEKNEKGFWYRVTYIGDGEPLKPEDTVDVVVEESLINGKVVSDMDLAGNSLRQKVRDFPPVFSAGLLRLKNHGQITLVVPPELAYGDKGYPPDVPPGATMIYRVRVADRIMESESQPAAPVRPGSKERILGRRAG